MMKKFEPRIIGFLCNWCSYAGADLAGVSRKEYPTNLKIIRVMCSSRVDPLFVIRAFQDGADAVLIAGCHPGECHYSDGNYYTRRRMLLMKKLLEYIGVDPRRLRLEWISSSEGNKFSQIVNEMIDEIRELGPLKLEWTTKR